MRPCLSTLGCPDWTTVQILDCVRELRFEGIEIRGLEGEMLLPESAHLQPGSDFLGGLASAGCSVAVLGSSAAFARPEEALQECRLFVECAAAIGCPIVRVFGGGVSEGCDLGEAAKGFAPALREACEMASDHGVTIGLETHDAWCRGDECALILDAVDHPSLCIVWDTHHSYRHGEALADTVAAIGNRLVHVHLKDSVARQGEVKHTLFGEGDLPLREILQVLRTHGYEGFVSLEWEKRWHPELPEPEVAFPQFRSKLEELLGQLA